MKKITLLVLLVLNLLFNQLSSAQSTNNWTIKKESEVSKTRLKIDKKTIPSKFKVLSLDFKSLQTNLKSASKRTINNKLSPGMLLDFPLEDGTMESFSIEKASVLAPELEAKYPEIQSYYGVSNKNPLNKIYISTSPDGFTGLITGDKTIYIDPVSKNDVSDYIVYDRKDCTRDPNDAFVCNAAAEAMTTAKSTTTAKTTSTTDGNLRTYRLALACTSAYSLYYGNTLAQVIAAMNTTITRVNSVYRRDLSVVFQLVANNDRLIYINGFNKDASPDPDPYSNYDGTSMLNANSSNIDGIIGSANYDIGHVFSTGGGGIAGTGPCSTTGANTGKGRGVTGIVTPQFDPFDVDYVCHEIGHQFGAAHTYYNACFGSKELVADYEPGSASTIMGYAGICTPNVQENSDAYFHAKSIEQMTSAISGHACVTGTASGNAAPVITALTARTIPKSTPFILTATAVDAQGDPMTYTWEQYDNNDGGVQPPATTNTAGPVFRSLMPTSDPSRTFPNLAAIIANTTPTWEVLPSVARTLNFRVTVRDNSTLGGRTDYKAVAITVGNVGPFAVTAPNTSTVWYVGQSQTVTWNFTGTDNATYSVNVNIKLSIDGGLTYPITLVSATPNDGTQAITVPNNIGTNNRIKVEAAANIFFDISNANFEIKANTFDLTATQPTVSVCKPTSAVYTLNYTPAPGFSETTTFSAAGIPVGAIATFVPTTRSTAGTVTMTVSGITSVATGNYSFNANGASTSANINLPLTLKVFDNTIGNVTLTSPSNGATNQQTSSLLQWSAITSASSYIVEVSTSPTFATIKETATVTTNSYQTTALTQGTINYWRVKPVNTCVNGANSEVYMFQIASDITKTYTIKNTDANTAKTGFFPDALWANNSTNEVSAKIDIPDDINVSKVTFNMQATHASVNDLKMQFSGPTGIYAEIYNRDCASGANFNVTFDDAGTVLTCGSNPGLGGTQQASQRLAKFNGTSSLGQWTLLATDRVATASGGTFTQFSITITGKLQIVNNITVASNPITLVQATTATITQAKLGATQPTATTTQLVYTVTQLPTNGVLKLNNVAIVTGGTFTQADINNNLVSYTNNGANSNPDSFKYAISGVNLAILGGQTFTITVTSCTVVTPTFTAVAPICTGGSLSALPTTSTNGITGSWSPTLNNTTTTTYTFTPNVQCANTTTLSITVNPISVAGTVSSNQTICSGSQPNDITLTGNTGSIQWQSSTDNVTFTNVIGETANTLSGTTIGVLTAPKYFRAIVTSGVCSSATSATVTITLPTTTWNGSLWSNGVPTSTTAATIAGNYNASANINACTLTVNNNAIVTIPYGFNVTLNGALTVSSGSFTLNNNANLIQSSNAANSGNINVKRETATLMRLDYVMWSSPVTGSQALGAISTDFSPLTTVGRFYTYNSATNVYNVALPTTPFASGTGYLIRLPNNHPSTPTIWSGTFTGVPNNGNVNVTVVNGTYNAVGNPYPSTINADTFITNNNITEALYFWRKSNNSTSTSYATYTKAGGAGTTSANLGDPNGIVPNGIIQVGQGFIAKSTSTSIQFTNAMRIANNQNQFLRTKTIERNRIWLNLSKDTTPLNQMMVAYMTDATQDIDPAIDGKYINDSQTALNSLINNEEFVIQGRSTPFDPSDVVPLSFKTTTSGNFTIGIDHVDGLFSSSQDIILKDNSTGVETDLKANPYSFTAVAGVDNARFSLKYQKTLGVNSAVFNENTISVYKNNGVIKIKSGTVAIDNVKLFDASGRLLFEKKKINSNEVSIESSKFAKQVLIVQITSGDKKVINKKLVN